MMPKPTFTVGGDENWITAWKWRRVPSLTDSAELNCFNWFALGYDVGISSALKKSKKR
jgi:hypothetical protein